MKLDLDYPSDKIIFWTQEQIMVFSDARSAKTALEILHLYTTYEFIYLHKIESIALSFIKYAISQQDGYQKCINLMDHLPTICNR